MKKCPTCKRLLPESDFYKSKTKADGLCSQCKECNKQLHKQYYEANREQIREYQRQYSKKYRKNYYEANHEKALEYQKQYRSANREKLNEYQKQYRKQWRAANHEKFREQQKQYYASNPEKHLWMAAKARAKKRGLEFNLELSDIEIPEFCPVLGLRLEQGNGRMQDNSPTLDRIDSSKGYVKGNIEVISWRANRLKNDATPEDLQKLATYYKRNSK